MGYANRTGKKMKSRQVYEARGQGRGEKIKKGKEIIEEFNEKK